MRFDRGYISPYFVTDNKAQTVEFENPLLLLVEKKISTLQSILPVLESAVKTQRPLLIISEDVESEALATLVINKLRGGIKVCAVKAPGFGDNRKATLQDIAVLTGGTVISEDLGIKLENVADEHLGTCAKVKVSRVSFPSPTSLFFVSLLIWNVLFFRRTIPSFWMEREIRLSLRSAVKLSERPPRKPPLTTRERSFRYN